MQKPGCIEDVDTQRKLIEDLPSKISEIVEDVKLIQPWYETIPGEGCDCFVECRRTGGCGCWMRG